MRNEPITYERAAEILNSGEILKANVTPRKQLIHRIIADLYRGVYWISAENAAGVSQHMGTTTNRALAEELASEPPQS